MATARDMGIDMAKVTGTDTDMDDPNTVTITISKSETMYVYRLLEASAVVRQVFLQLSHKMREKGVVLRTPFRNLEGGPESEPHVVRGQRSTV